MTDPLPRFELRAKSSFRPVMLAERHCFFNAAFLIAERPTNQ
jgi:hypothetical protein